MVKILLLPEVIGNSLFSITVKAGVIISDSCNEEKRNKKARLTINVLLDGLLIVMIGRLMRPFSKEIVPFIIYDDESREIFYPDFPDSFHA